MNPDTLSVKVGPRVIVESPFKASESRTAEENMTYAIEAVNDCLHRGEAPFASHVLYTHTVENGDESEHPGFGRVWSINAGLAWIEVADKIVVYEDYGITNGMECGIRYAKKLGKPIEYRKIKLPLE